MFWGVTLDQDSSFTSTLEKELCLSMAALESRVGKSHSIGTFAQVILTTADSTEHLLCTLVHGVLFQQALDIKLSIGEAVSVKVEGKGTIHLSGYFQYKDLATETMAPESYNTVAEPVIEEFANDDDDSDGDDADDMDSSWMDESSDLTTQQTSSREERKEHSSQQHSKSLQSRTEEHGSSICNEDQNQVVLATSWEEVRKKIKEVEAQQRSNQLKRKVDVKFENQNDSSTRWSHYKQKLRDEDPQKFEHLRQQRKLASQRYRAKLREELQQKNPSKEAVEKAEKIRLQNRIRSQRARNKRLLRTFMSNFSESVKASPSKLEIASPEVAGDFTIVEITTTESIEQSEPQKPAETIPQSHHGENQTV